MMVSGLAAAGILNAIKADKAGPLARAREPSSFCKTHEKWNQDENQMIMCIQYV